MLMEFSNGEVIGDITGDTVDSLGQKACGSRLLTAIIFYKPFFKALLKNYKLVI